MAEEQTGGEGEAAAPAKPKFKLPPMGMLLAVINTVFVLIALSTVVYTKMLYKRPTIDEDVEFKKMADAAKLPEAGSEKALFNFDQMTVNIAQTSGKAHFVTIAFSVECRDSETASAVKQLKSQLTDKVIASLAKRQITELNTIQGKLLLKTELMRVFNEILNGSAKIPAGITDIFFANFILQ